MSINAIIIPANIAHGVSPTGENPEIPGLAIRRLVMSIKMKRTIPRTVYGRLEEKWPDHC